MSFYRKQLEDYLGGLEIKGGVIYDVGGAQKSLEGRTKLWEPGAYTVLDLPAHDIEQWWRWPDLERLRFGADTVFALEVFEYLINPQDALEGIWQLLKDGGKLIASFPLVYPVHNEVDLDSLRYTEAGIKRLAKATNFEVAKVHYRRAANDHLAVYYQLDGMRAAKGVDHNVTGYIVELAK